jgi:uncharacterized protein involved in response to NO
MPVEPTSHRQRQRWIITVAPHRLFFLGGALQLVCVLVFWLDVLIGWYLPVWAPPSLTVAAPLAHVFLMLYGLFTFFVFGFLFTVYPRWLQTAIVPRWRYTTIAIMLSSAMACFYVGVFTSRLLATLGVVLYALGWAGAVLTLLQVWLSSSKTDKRFALFPLTFVMFGLVGNCVYAGWLIRPASTLFDLTLAVGLWLYLVPLIVAVSHRMIPFFSSSVLKPYTIVKPSWTVPAMLVCVLLHGALDVTGNAQWTVLADSPLAGMAIWHSWRWGLMRSLRIPLLGMLHVSFFWLGISMLLYAAQSLLRLSGAGFDLGLAPLHALGIGFISGMVIAMASRVSLGHSGRALVADRVTLWAFAILQFVAVLRILAEVPPFVHHRASMWLILTAGAVWLIALVPWSMRFAGVYFAPRVDGVPG